MAAENRQKIEGVDPAHDESSDSDRDMEPLSGEGDDGESSEEEAPEVAYQKNREQTTWTGELALEYYHKLKGEKYVLVDPIHSNGLLLPVGIVCHSLFTAKKVLSSSTDSSPPTPKMKDLSSSTDSSPPTPKMVIDGSVESSPPTPEVVVNNDSGSSSTPDISPTPSLSPNSAEYFFSEIVQYGDRRGEITVISCLIMDPSSASDPPRRGCHNCSKYTKPPFYHPPEEKLEFGKHEDDTRFGYDEKWTSSDEETEIVPCLIPPHRRIRKL